MSDACRGRGLTSCEHFPILTKLIFPKDKLSIQVHPDDAYAAKHEQAAGGRGKTEMWYIVSAEPGARLLAGLKAGVTKDKFQTAIKDHALEELFQSYEVHSGDAFFLPAGTPHTIGPGMIVCEVQEYSDLTYRVYDYNRVDASGKPRELHIEKALDVIDFQSAVAPKVDPRPWLPEEFQTMSGRGMKSGKKLVDCPYFSASIFEAEQPVHFNMGRRGGSHEKFAIWIFLEGEGMINWSCQPRDLSRANSGEFGYKQGECWFIPAAFGNHGYYPQKKTTLLIASPGDKCLPSDLKPTR